MEKDAKKSWISRLVGGDSDMKIPKFYYVIVILVVLGMLMMSFLDVKEQAIPYDRQQPPKVEETSGFIDRDSDPKTMQDYEKIYENELTDFLTDMLGLDEVNVKVNLESTEEIVVEKNISLNEQVTKEKDKQGGTREIKDHKKDEQVVIYRTDSNEKPLILKTLKPRVRGVVIVAKGAEKVQIKAMITEAVQRLLDIPPHKIGIYPKYN